MAAIDECSTNFIALKQKRTHKPSIKRTFKWLSFPQGINPNKRAGLAVNNALNGHKFPGGNRVRVDVDWRPGRRMDRVGSWSWGMKCWWMSWGVNWCAARAMAVVVTSVGLRGRSRGKCREAMG